MGPQIIPPAVALLGPFSPPKNIFFLKKKKFFFAKIFLVCTFCAHVHAQKNAKNQNYIAIPFICHLHDRSVTTQSWVIGMCLLCVHACVQKKTQKFKTILQYLSFAAFGSALWLPRAELYPPRTVGTHKYAPSQKKNSPH